MVLPALLLAACARPDRPAEPGDRVSSIPAGTHTAGFGRFGLPDLSPAPSMPDEEAACRTNLDRLGVRWVDRPAIREGACGIDWPIEVSSLPGNVALEPAATLNCAMALSFSRWVKAELQPAARRRYLSGVAVIRQGSAYACRNMNGARESTLSEHATGNAIDVMEIRLNNGKAIDVRKPGLFSFRQRGLLSNVRGEACDYFSTVLGPGYNREHRDHFHFDMRPRKGGRVSCH